MPGCKLPYKTAEANAKAALRTLGAIDKYLNITDFKEFQKQQVHFTAHGKRAYNIDTKWFETNDLGTKAIPNKFAFKQVDDQNNVHYQMTNSTDIPEITEAQSAKLNAKLKKLLTTLGFKYENLDNIKNRNGEPVSAIGKADLLLKLVEVVEKNADPTTLPEEVATVFLSLMDRKSPLIKAMMDEVVGMDVYQEVVDEYATIYEGDTEKLKFEAVTKVAAKAMIEQFTDTDPYKVSRVKRWFKRLWQSVLESFGKAVPKEFKVPIEEFYQVAEMIVQEDVEGLNPESFTNEEFFQLEDDPDGVKLLLAKLTSTTELLIPPEYKDEDDNRYSRHTDTGIEEIANRVTDAQDRKFVRTMGKDVADKINKSKKSEIQRKSGIKLHILAEQLVEHYANGKKAPKAPKFLSPASWKNLQNGVKSVVDQANNLQTRINPEGKATFLTEAMIHDPDKDIAGSLDMVVIFSDRTAARYDWKFMNMKKQKVKGKWMYPELISAVKEDSFDLQASEYDRILRDVYKVKKIRQSRVIPANVQYVKNSKKQMTSDIDSLTMGGESAHLQQVPLADEQLSFNVKLNSLLTSLQGLKSQVKVVAQKDYKNEKLQKRYEDLRKQVRALQLSEDIVPVLQSAIQLLKGFEKHVGIHDPENDLYLNDEQLYDYKKHLELYSNLIEYTRSTKKADKTKSDIDKVNASVINAISDIDNMLFERVQTLAEAAGIGRIATKEGDDWIPIAQKEVGFTGRLMTYLSRFKHPVMKLLSNSINEINDSVRENVTELDREVSVHKKALLEWGRQNGYDANEITKFIINPRTGDLLGRYTKELYEKQEQAIVDEDVAWMKLNFHMSAESKKRFEEVRKERFANLDTIYADNDKTRSIKKQQWLSKYDLSRDSAWLNRDNWFLSVKESSKWESNEWKFVRANKPLADFYDFHKEKMIEFGKLIPGEIRPNFVGNIHKDMIDQLGENGLFSKESWKGTAASFFQSFQVREGDSTFGMVDPETNRKIFTVPVLFTDPIYDRYGKVDPSQKSTDLLKNLMLFGRMAYNHDASKKQEAKINMMREVLMKTPHLSVDRYGRPEKKAGEELGVKGINTTVETFDAFVNYYLYGQKVQGSDSILESKAIEWINKALAKTGASKEVQEFIGMSGNKVAKTVLGYYSARLLSFNVISAGGGFLGALGNTFITGTKQNHYTNAQIIEMSRKWATRDEKLKTAIQFFDVSQEDMNYLRANNQSLNNLAKVFTMDNAFILQRKVDDLIDYFTLGAMMKSYGIDSEGKIKKLSRIKGSTTSLWDIAKIEDGKFTIEGTDKKELNRFRRAVKKIAARNKGNASHEDINLIKTTIIGQALMQFKNWMPAMINERFEKGRYDEDLDEIELGRFRVAFGEIFHTGFIPILKNFINLGVEIAALGIFNNNESGKGTNLFSNNMNNAMSKHYFTKFLKENLELLETHTEEELFALYVETRKQQLRAFAAELRAYALSFAALAGVVAAYSSEEDDDTWWFKKLFKITDRMQLELGVFINPYEYTKIAQNFIPIIGLALDTFSWVGNTLDEMADIFVPGEGFFREKKRDRHPQFKYTLKAIPSVKGVADFFFFFDTIANWEKNEHK